MTAQTPQETTLQATTSQARIPIIEARLNAALAPLYLQITDDSAKHAGHAGAKEGGHYSVKVVSAQFTGASRVTRHRMVYDALADAMQRGIHALAISAYTPEEFESLK